jgi:hypothetical protein
MDRLMIKLLCCWSLFLFGWIGLAYTNLESPHKWTTFCLNLIYGVIVGTCFSIFGESITKTEKFLFRPLYVLVILFGQTCWWLMCTTGSSFLGTYSAERFAQSYPKTWVGIIIFLFTSFQLGMLIVLLALSRHFIWKLLRSLIEKIKNRNHLPLDFFSKVGLAHVHIDGARNRPLILEIVQDLSRIGMPGRLNEIVRFVAGPQRQILPAVYQSHTPVLAGKESLDFFSTNQVPDRDGAVVALDLIMEKLQAVPGAVVELEQVVAIFNETGWQFASPDKALSPLQASEVRFSPATTWSYEIHHGFDLLKTKTAPLALANLLAHCSAQGITVGGWFLFERPNHWAYRSNSFINSADFQAQVEREHSVIRHFLEDQGLQAEQWTSVEQVLGIWNSPAAE